MRVVWRVVGERALMVARGAGYPISAETWRIEYDVITFETLLICICNSFLTPTMHRNTNPVHISRLGTWTQTARVTGGNIRSLTPC